MATVERSVITISVLHTGSRVSTAAVRVVSIALVNSATGPSNMKKVTNTPTVTNATSLTSDSVAIARMSPSWCSVASMWRVPNRTANAAIASATNSAMSPSTGCGMPVVMSR